MERWKSNFISWLLAFYVLGLLLLTVAFFTPWWAVGYHRGPYNSTTNRYKEECNTAGLVSGQCRYPFHGLSESDWHLEEMERWKSNFISWLLAFYVLGLLLLTVAFFTPWWTVGYHRGPYLWSYRYEEECNTAGLVSGQCRYPFHDLSKSQWHLGLILRLSFWFVLAAMILSYSNAMLILAAFTCKLYKSEVFMSFLAISCGVFYPIAGLFSVVSAGFVIATYSKEAAFSSYACGVAGCINLACYAGLRWYDHHYSKSRQQRKLLSQKLS